jgi:hypothetical protein
MTHIAISSDPGRSIEVDLAAVTLVDSCGIELLARMRRNGAVLAPTGLLMKAVVEEIEHQAKKRKNA